MKFMKMMSLAATFVLLPFATAFSADASAPVGSGPATIADAMQGTSGTFYGDVGGTAEVANINGNKAKFSEYQDMTNHGGFYSNARLGYDSDNFYLKARASDIGYGTQSYNLDTGMYGIFKFNAFEDSIIHNITLGAITPFSGAGSNTLTAPLMGVSSSRGTSYYPSNTNSATWNTFDYKIQRNQYGGGIKVDVLNPVYADFSMSREDRRGNLPWSNGNGVEIPAPVDYETTLYNGEIGYRANPLFASLNYTYGTFTNQNQEMLVSGTGALSNGSSSTTLNPTQAMLTLPPDNHFYKLGFKGVLQLPFNSRINLNLADEYQKSNVDLTNILNFNNAQVTSAASKTGLNQDNFDGRKHIQNYAFSLTSNPIRLLDVKLYYKYYDMANQSSTIIQTVSGVPNPTYLFGYKKNSYGTDFGFRLPEDFHLSLGYAYIDTDRENRPDIPSTKDNVYSAELRWNGLDFLTPKVGYERLMRLAQYGTPYSLNYSSGNQNFTQFNDFDGTKQGRDTYKVAIDSSPLDTLNVGVAYKYKKSTYPDTFLGVQNATTNELETYGDYLIGGLVRINGYFDIQDTKQNLLDFVGTQAAVSLAETTSTSNYAWTQTTKDNTYEFGAGADVYLVPKKLTLRVQYDYVNSDGFEDFGFFTPNPISGVNANSSSGPIGNPNLNDVDSYHKSAFMCKLNYASSKSFTMAIGATYEQFKYNDYAFSGTNYQYVNGTTYLTGAYANPNYNATIVFVSAAYKF